MAHIEKKMFDFGNTLKVRAEVKKVRSFEDEYQQESIVGIDALLYNNTTGEEGDPDWVALEKNTDIGELLKEIESLKNQVKHHKMYNGRLKRKLQSLEMVTEDIEEGTDA